MRVLAQGKACLTDGLKDRTRLLEQHPCKTDNNVCFMLMDFGGDEAYTMMHHLFLDRKALAMIVYDASTFKPEDYDSVIGRWLTMLMSYAPGVVVKLVATKCDLLEPPKKEGEGEEEGVEAGGEDGVGKRKKKEGRKKRRETRDEDDRESLRSEASTAMSEASTVKSSTATMKSSEPVSSLPSEKTVEELPEGLEDSQSLPDSQSQPVPQTQPADKAQEEKEEGNATVQDTEGTPAVGTSDEIMDAQKDIPSDAPQDGATAEGGEEEGPKQHFDQVGKKRLSLLNFLHYLHGSTYKMLLL